MLYFTELLYFGHNRGLLIGYMEKPLLKMRNIQDLVNLKAERFILAAFQINVMSHFPSINFRSFIFTTVFSVQGTLLCIFPISCFRKRQITGTGASGIQRILGKTALTFLLIHLYQLVIYLSQSCGWLKFHCKETTLCLMRRTIKCHDL